MERFKLAHFHFGPADSAGKIARCPPNGAVAGEHHRRCVAKTKQAGNEGNERLGESVDRRRTATGCEWNKGSHGFGVPLKALPEWFVKGRPRRSSGRFTFTTWNYFTKHSPLLPSGQRDAGLFLNQVVAYVDAIILDASRAFALTRHIAEAENGL